MSSLFGDDWISRKYIERYPDSVRTRSWAGKIVAAVVGGKPTVEATRTGLMLEHIHPKTPSDLLALAKNG